MKQSRVMEFAKQKYEISFLGGPTTPTYSTSKHVFTKKKKKIIIKIRISRGWGEGPVSDHVI